MSCTWRMGRCALLSSAAAPLPPLFSFHQSTVYTPPPTLAVPDSSSLVNLIGHDPAHGEGVELAEGEELIVADMVGTFYSAPAPNEDPYVAEGDEVEPGQVVGIIEAMKMMNRMRVRSIGSHCAHPRPECPAGRIRPTSDSGQDEHVKRKT